MNLKSGGAPRCLEAPDKVAYCALSPDSRWLAAGTLQGNGVRIWSLTEAVPPKDLPIHGSAKVAFSCDGGWLATGDTEYYRLWKTGTWERGRDTPSEMGEHYGAMAYSPRKTALAIARRRSELKILHPVTLEEMASPDFDHEAPLCFDPTGMIMVTFGPSGGLFFWQLDTLRGLLEERELDWKELKPFPPVSFPAVGRVIVPVVVH